MQEEFTSSMVHASKNDENETFVVTDTQRVDYCRSILFSFFQEEKTLTKAPFLLTLKKRNLGSCSTTILT